MLKYSSDVQVPLFSILSGVGRSVSESSRTFLPLILRACARVGSVTIHTESDAVEQNGIRSRTLHNLAESNLD